MLTVACVFVQGPYPYTVDYVVRLHRMVRQYLRRPFDFVCLTDQPEAVLAADEAIGVVRIPSFRGVVPENGVGFWSKVRLFDPLFGFHGRVLYLDLDTLVVAPLDPIVDYPAPLALCADELQAVNQRDRFQRRTVGRFNSSVMVWDAGTQTDLWTRWSPAVAQQLSTDQDWIGEQAETAQAMPVAWFPRISRVQPPWPAAAKVVLVKKPKNHVAAQRWPWFKPLWGAA